MCGRLGNLGVRVGCVEDDRDRRCGREGEAIVRHIGICNSDRTAALLTPFFLSAPTQARYIFGASLIRTCRTPLGWIRHVEVSIARTVIEHDEGGGTTLT